MIDTELATVNRLYEQGKFIEAKAGFEKIIQEHPDTIGAYHNLGLTCYQLGDFARGLEMFDHAYKNGSHESLICRGNCYRALDQYELALADYGQAFIENHRSASAYCNYGNTLREMGEPELAIPFLQVSQKLDPTNITTIFNESVAHLLSGNLLAGWDLYESRWQYDTQKGLKPEINRPEITINDIDAGLEGKTVLLYSEQGFGDTIQFCRYIINLRNKGAKIILVTRPELFPLFVGDASIKVTDNFENIGNFDYHCALLSLPRAFRTTLETIPAPIKYLNANEKAVQWWKKTLGPKTKMRIGLTWTGNRATWINRYKSMSLNQLVPLLSAEYQFVNLQHDATVEELDLLKQHNVLIVNDQLKNFHDTAALVSNLDLVISVDTAVAHLSGALGVPTWIMLNAYGTDWRWLLNRSDNPWYPTARLFRQPSFKDWTTVVSDIKQHLKLFKI
jgi:tetratricopeptide (TPR) repeat protein